MSDIKICGLNHLEYNLESIRFYIKNNRHVCSATLVRSSTPLDGSNVVTGTGFKLSEAYLNMLDAIPEKILELP